MKKVKALSRLAGGKPHGCNVGKDDKNDEPWRELRLLFVSGGVRGK